ncbi:MAG: hypothetical protein MRY57_04195 [Candidatus Pacebacteria bacterium]|nr:hypothetical protein [Candidatus Paceibacterota bacterium]
MKQVNHTNNILGYVLALKSQYQRESLIEAFARNNEKLSALASDIPFDSPKDCHYKRQVLGKEFNDNETYDENFEVIMGHWKPTKTSCRIHGHPQYMYYQILSGKYLMHLYKIIDTQQKIVEPVQSMIMLPGDTFGICAQSRTMCNGIHSMQCLEAGQTLHIYSDDALKGEIFTKK